MREAIALIIVIMMWAFAATQAEWAMPYTSHVEYNQQITTQVITYINHQQIITPHNRMPTIEKLIAAYKITEEESPIRSSLEKITTHLMDVQESAKTPIYKTL